MYTKKVKNKILPHTELYELASMRQGELAEAISAKKAALAKMPEGKIHVIKKNSSPQYYLREKSSDRAGKYISKSKESLISTYLQKSYDEKVLRLMLREHKALDKLLQTTNGINQSIQNVYSTYPEEIKKIVIPIDYSDEQYASNWLEETYDKKSISDSYDAFVTDKGDKVRSKSELIIANALFRNNIPYKYECPLILKGGVLIHPDFTVLNVTKRKVIYWEHRGMMDDREYAKHTVSRLKDYMKNDIYLGDNLIITEETSNVPLTTSEIMKVVQHFF